MSAGKIPLTAVIVVLVAASVPAKETFTKPATRPAKVNITISKETTYITGPLNPDGTVNYVEYLNKKYSEGVIKENNAFVGLFKAIGPELVPQNIRDKVYKRLNMKPLPADGEYFTPLVEYTRKNNIDEIKTKKQFDKAQQAPWRPDDYPLVAAWLKANKKPLTKIAQSVRLENYYSPLVCYHEPPCALELIIPSMGKYRVLSRIFIARAMMNIGTSDPDGAGKDLITVHCLSRRIGHEPFLVSRMVSIANDQIATQAETILLNKHYLSASQAKELLNELRGLKRLPDIREPIRIERFYGLDCVMMLSRGDMTLAELDSMITSLQNYDEEQRNKYKTPLRPSHELDWDVILRRMNHWYDRSIEAAYSKTHAKRCELYRQLEDDLIEIRMKSKPPGPDILSNWDNFKSSLTSLIRDRRNRSQIVSDTLASMLIPCYPHATTFWFKQRVELNLVKVALALEAYRGRNMKYPEKLSDLTKGYLTEIPKDLFTNKPLHYRRTEDGYMLYSVGPNMKDDGGVENEDEGKDDIVIRVE